MTSATYDGSTGDLVVTGADLVGVGGGTDIDASTFTLTGDDGATYTLTDTADVEITSGTEFTLTLSAADQSNVASLLNSDGTGSQDSTTYNVATADKWNSSGSTADASGNGITVSNAAALPTMTSATYDGSTGDLVVTGTDLVGVGGALNDIDASTFTLTGDNGATYTLTDTADVEITSPTEFTLTLSDVDKMNAASLLNNDGSGSQDSTIYNLASADDWNSTGSTADAAGNAIIVSSAAPLPAITSTTYDASTGTFVVTGTNFVGIGGDANDIDVSLFTVTGVGGSTYTLTDTLDVEVTSTTEFTINLSTTDKAEITSLISKDGGASHDSTTYNLATADNWNSGASTANPTNTIVAFNTDNIRPTLLSVVWDDVDSSFYVTEDDTLTFTFSEPMDTSTIDNAGGAADVDIVLPPSAGEYGTGAKSVSWTDSTTLVVTIGDAPIIERGTTFDPTDAVTDIAGNIDNTTYIGGPSEGPGFVDPFGVVFDSVSNAPIEGVVVTCFTSLGVLCERGTHILGTDQNPQTTGSTGEYSFNVIAGDYYLTVGAPGYTYPSTKSTFPAGRTIVDGSKGEVFTVTTVIIEMDHPVDGGSTLLTVTKDANKKDVTVGDIVTYTVTLSNSSTIPVTAVYLEDRIPAGFKYISGKAILDGVAISDPTGNRPLTFTIGTVAAGQTRTLKYQLVVGSGVSFGNYENTAFAKYVDGTAISNTASESVKVVPDVLFDLSTVIGKVFHDRNGNGIQDLGEEPIPNVRIVTEDGTLITTGKDGKYHLPGIMPGRHLFRLDERTLPAGATLTTDKGVIVDITAGLLRKVNFGVKLSEGVELEALPFQISQVKGTPTPRLNVSLFNDELIIDGKALKQNAEFRIFTNYHLFIEGWELEIFAEDTKGVVRRLKGTKEDIYKPIYWDGKDDAGKLIAAGRAYAYRLTVVSPSGEKDITKEQRLGVVKSTHNAVTLGVSSSDEEGSERYKAWSVEENSRNNLENQTIVIKGETIKISGSRLPITHLRIINNGAIQGEVPFAQPKVFTAGDLLEAPELDGKSEAEPIDIIIPSGEYDIEVTTSGLQGKAAGVNPAYSKKITVGDDYLFFVAMGDAKMGYTFSSGDVEVVQHDDKFKKGFWAEGKFAYYLKGKIKGKYIITSSFDTERAQKALFKEVESDKYYPVYGDDSSVNHDAANTQGMLYLLIEWDKSSALWGNYNTALTETELAQFNRTLYGGKVHLESLSTTKFGAPTTKLIIFSAQAQQKAAHNEFTGTGGSLFYLKHKDVIEGSEKVAVEIRDKISGLVLATYEMTGGEDYEINYSQGRIIFWKAISQVAESNSIISSHLLDGNPIYVVADYEYEVNDTYDKSTSGGRVQKSLGDHVDIGATYVKEELERESYVLKGTDVTVHVSENIQLTAEYAESESEATGSFISTNGGVSFTELPTAEYSRGKAYGIKGEAGFMDDRLNLSGYYKWIGSDFSTSATSSQQGKELIGVNAAFEITPDTRLILSHSRQKLINDGNPQTRLQVGADESNTTSAQVTHDMGRLKLTGEYRHQDVNDSKDEFESEVNHDEDVVAVRADYKLSDKTDLSLEQQVTLSGQVNNQTRVGIETKVNDWLSLRAKETVGNQGSATSIGATASVKERLDLSADYTRSNNKIDENGDSASVSAAYQVDEKTKVHTTYAANETRSDGRTSSLVYGTKKQITESLEYTADRSIAKTSDSNISSNIFGLSGDISDQWSVSGSIEQGIIQHHDGSRDKRTAGSIGLGYVEKDEETGDVLFKASSKLELRFDEGQEDKRQYLFHNRVERKISADTTLFATANLSQTRNLTIDLTEAEYKELVLGIAYRPVKIDWLNILGKYTYLENESPASQNDINGISNEAIHVMAAEAVIDLTEKVQYSGKFAYKTGKETVAGFSPTKTSTWLMINRFGYRIEEDWEVAAEYRILNQRQARDRKHGALFEISKDIGKHIQVGVGYNFTQFNDDLTRLDYTSHGPFLRITGKFY
ncbi:MAG: SdrD B-like domain-containing protein [Sedimenticola sp.]